MSPETESGVTGNIYFKLKSIDYAFIVLSNPEIDKQTIIIKGTNLLLDS